MILQEEERGGEEEEEAAAEEKYKEKEDLYNSKQRQHTFFSVFKDRNMSSRYRS